MTQQHSGGVAPLDNDGSVPRLGVSESVMWGEVFRGRKGLGAEGVQMALTF